MNAPRGPDVTKPASALAAPSTGFSQHPAAGATVRAPELYQHPEGMEDMDTVERGILKMLMSPPDAHCAGCDETPSSVGVLGMYRVRFLDGSSDQALYCDHCASLIRTSIAMPRMGYGAMALPDQFISIEPLVLIEQREHEGRVLREAGVSTDDAAIVARIVDDIEERPFAVAARMLEMGRDVARLKETVSRLCAHEVA